MTTVTEKTLVTWRYYLDHVSNYINSCIVVWQLKEQTKPGKKE